MKKQVDLYSSSDIKTIITTFSSRFSYTIRVEKRENRINEPLAEIEFTM